MKTNIFKYYILILSLISSVTGYSQENKKNNRADTTTLHKIEKKTIKDSLDILKQIKADRFYDTLTTRASKNRFTKTALDFLLVKAPDTGAFIGIEQVRSEEYYNLFIGKRIRKIEIIKLDVWGPSITDTSEIQTRWIEKAANNFHVKTRDFIIKNNLFFHSGDTIDPALLIDNERFLRAMDYIRDASIQIIQIPNEPDLVDVLVVTKDVFSTGFYVELLNPYSGIIDLYENNLAGIGQKIQASLYIDSREDPVTGYGFSYKVENIGETFISSNIQYIKAFYSEKLKIELGRKFISYQTKWAGGISLNKISTLIDINKIDTTLLNVRLDYLTQDIWLGRSFLLKTSNWQYTDRTRLVVSSRYINNVFNERPIIQQRYNYPYHNNQIALMGLSYSRQKYFISNLIYAFGKTEDIPIGCLIQVNGGFENNEFFNRSYLGFQFSKGNYFPKIGYLNFKAEYGSFFSDNSIEQGTVNFSIQSISNLHYINKLKTREFLRINYTRGINHFYDEIIYLNKNDIAEFKTNNIYGLQKISFHSELVNYSNWHIYNFKFLFYAFGDLALIGPENKSLFNNKLYSGVGIGIRIRNENLVFKTFQIRFAYYPTIPTDMVHFNFFVTGENYNKPIQFEPIAPYIIEYN